MRKTCILAVMTAMVLLFSVQAQAALQNLGTDSVGNRLIYDSDLDITWYDFYQYGNWQAVTDWVSGLSVTFGSNVYDDWRLPTTTQPDSSCDSQYDPGGGFSIQGYGFNCTGCEMGHLYYTELGNAAGGPMTNTGDFQHVPATGAYWSGTEVASSPTHAYYFSFLDGYQTNGLKIGGISGIAVRPGLAVTPEPMSMILFGAGGVVMALARRRKKRPV